MNARVRLGHRPDEAQHHDQFERVPPVAWRASRIAVGGAAAAVLLWAAKALVIALAGGLDKSAAEAPLFFLGLAAALTGAAALGVVLAARKGRLVRVVAAVAGIVALAAVAGLTQLVVDLVQGSGDGWVWGEVNLWVAASTLLAAGLAWRSRHGQQRD